MSKQKVTVTLDSELLDWLQSQIRKKVFGSISHGLERLIYKAMQREGKEEIEERLSPTSPGGKSQ